MSRAFFGGIRTDSLAKSEFELDASGFLIGLLRISQTSGGTVYE
jgi:hypothetical protein